MLFLFSTKTYVPAHNKIYNKTYANREDPDQSAGAVWSVFADCTCLQQSPGYPKTDRQEPLPYWVDVQADLSLIVDFVMCRLIIIWCALEAP